MKKYIIFFLALFPAIVAVHSQEIGNGIRISGLNVTETDGAVEVSFVAEIPKKGVAGDNTLVFAPVLTDGTYKVSMPAVIVQGRRAQRSMERYEWVAGDSFTYDGAAYAQSGTSVSYSASVEAQLWMQGADIMVESVLGGCCSYRTQPEILLARDLRLWEEVIEEMEYETEVFIPQTLADTLSISFPFVVDAAEFDPSEPFKIYDDERENALIIYYAQNSSKISKDYRTNEQVLMNLTEVVRMIMEDPLSEVDHVVIGGFSSPEGNYEINDRLAFERAVSVKEHIIKTTGIRDEAVTVYNGSVDWRGLRYMLTKTNILERDRLIDIIDNVPVWDAKTQRGRLGEIMRLNNGVTYRYLMKEFFPMMRNGAFIKVYYKNK